MTTRSAVIALVREAIEANEESDEFLLGLSDHDIGRMVFFHPFAHEGHLRLSERGLNFLEWTYQAHRIELPEKYKVSAGDLLRIGHASNAPYYIDKNEAVVLFDGELAARLALMGNDLSLL